MRPRLRSYGLISTWTRSPGSTRIRCIRIFPELWARTSWPLSVLTRKVAFLRDSVTVPSSRMACSFVLVFDSVLHLLLWHGTQGSGRHDKDAQAIKPHLG